MLFSSERQKRLVKDHATIARPAGSNDIKSESTSSSDASLYDFVVVGGGTSGCVLSSRLSEDPSLKVLVLEAGESGVELLFSRIPAGYGQLFRHKHDHNLWTVPQTHAGNTKKYWPRGKMLGGSSSMNALVFHVGDRGDYDEWAEINKNEPDAEQWKYDNLHQYFQRFEKYTPNADLGKFNTKERGSEGPVEVGFHTNLSQTVSTWIKSCEAVGIPPTQDFNTSAETGTMGVCRTMTFVSPSKKRSSAESAYLTEEVLQRSNLTVAIHALVTRVIFDGNKAIGVEFVDTTSKKSFRVNVKQEVILSAGAVHSPAILLRSGIGPAEELKNHKIPLILDLPGVGNHLMDHPIVAARFRVKPGYSYNYLNPRNLGEQFSRLKALWQYFISGKGALTSNIAEGAAFVRSTDEKLFPKSDFPETITPSRATGPDLELFGMGLGFTEHGTGPIAPGDSICLLATAIRPTSLGSIKLKSSDPFVDPLINPNYLATQNDIDVLVRGFRLAVRIARTAPFSDLVVRGGPSSKYVDGDEIDKLDDGDLEALVRERTETAYHPACTARMAPRSEGGVVDCNLRVYGCEHLRVVDASVFTSLVSGHPAAACFAIGEKAADLIRRDVKRE